MGLIKCLDPNISDGKKIGTQEVLLWTNPRPGDEFNPQTITLSDSIFNYSLIKIEGRQQSLSSLKIFAWATPDYLATCETTGQGKSACALAAAAGGTGGVIYARYFKASSDGLNITFTMSRGISNGRGDASRSRPIYIYGIR